MKKISEMIPDFVLFCINENFDIVETGKSDIILQAENEENGAVATFTIDIETALEKLKESRFELLRYIEECRDIEQ